MGTAEDHDDLQSVIDFLGTPLVIDVLRAIRDGRSLHDASDLAQYGDAVDAAVAVLARAGTVAGVWSDVRHQDRPLMLTRKGKRVCALIDEVIDFEGPVPTGSQSPGRLVAGVLNERSFR